MIPIIEKHYQCILKKGKGRFWTIWDYYIPSKNADYTTFIPRSPFHFSRVMRENLYCGKKFTWWRLLKSSYQYKLAHFLPTYTISFFIIHVFYEHLACKYNQARKGQNLRHTLGIMPTLNLKIVSFKRRNFNVLV